MHDEGHDTAIPLFWVLSTIELQFLTNTTWQNFLNLIHKFFLTPLCHWTNLRQQLDTGILFRGYNWTTIVFKTCLDCSEAKPLAAELSHVSNDVKSTWLRIFCAFFALDKALVHLSSEGMGFWIFVQPGWRTEGEWKCNTEESVNWGTTPDLDTANSELCPETCAVIDWEWDSEGG